jgi:hypothetical protein
MGLAERGSDRVSSIKQRIRWRYVLRPFILKIAHIRIHREAFHPITGERHQQGAQAVGRRARIESGVLTCRVENHRHALAGIERLQAVTGEGDDKQSRWYIERTRCRLDGTPHKDNRWR